MIVLPTMACMALRAGVTAKLGIAGILLGRQYLDLSQVGLEVDRAHLGLQRADFAERVVQRLWRHGLGGEQVIELVLLLDQCVAQRLGLRFHGGEDSLGPAALLDGESERFGQFQYMGRAGKTVEFSRLGQPHALASQVSADVFRRKRLDLAYLLTRIGRRHLCSRNADGKRRKGYKANKDSMFHMNLSRDIG